MDGVKSGTGVFYQVMPGVSPDGKKVMKLIPGVMVNGRFVQTPGIKLQNAVAPQKLLPLNRSPPQTAKKIALSPPLTQQVINRVSLLNTVPSEVAVNVNNVPNKQPALQKYFLVNKPFGALEAAIPAVPVVMKAPALPGGQNMKSQNHKYFILKKPSVSTATIPAANEKSQFSSQLPVTVKPMALPEGISNNTVVQTVPVSELPPGIKKQCFTMLPSSPSGSGSDPSSGLPGVVNVTPITMARERAAQPAPTAPPEPSYKYFPGIQGTAKQLKLVQKAPQGPNGPCKWVIEEVDTAAPEDPPSVTPEALSALAGRMETTEHGAITPRPDPKSSPSRSGSGRSDAVVVCNGKVFVIAKKSRNTSATHELDEPQSEHCEKEQASSGGIQDQFEEVIDLCEDDDNVLSTAIQDEDNVIFVSYMPPRPKAPDLQLYERRRRPDGDAAGSDLPEPRGRSSDGRVGNDLSGLAEVVGSRSPEALSTGKSSRQEEVVEEEVVAENVVVEEEVVLMEAVEEMVAEEHTAGGMETSADLVSSSSKAPLSPTPSPCRSSDHQLRQMFDITADVRILLPRVDDPSAWIQPPPQNLCLSSRSLLLGVEAQQKPSAAATAHGTCSHGSWNSLACSSLPHLSPRTSKVAEAASFVEPIEEDFLSCDENQDLDGDWQPTQNTSSTSRGGRTRKRTRCPCCIPGSADPVGKSNARWLEAEPAAPKRSGKTNRQKADKKRPESE